MIEPRTLPGFMSLLPEDQVLFNKMKDVIKKNFEKYGFLPLDTPLLESSEILLAKSGGETEKQIYQIKRGDNDLCMRFDLTVPLAKYVAENLNNLNFPFARYEIAKVYRGERAQRGRFREFYQCDIDVIGRENLSILYDAQMPSIIYNIFKELDLGDFTIFVSNRKILIGFLQELGLAENSTEVLRLVDKLAKIGKENFEKSLKDDYDLSTEQIQKIYDVVTLSGSAEQIVNALENMKVANELFCAGVEELKQVTEYMKSFGVPEQNFKINLAIVRGHDYYTGTVYETFLNGKESIGSVCGGGRYDNLAEYYTKEKLP
ncbi:MAG: histidine--tRNA ligase, partial [Clostridia bacterium]|nr:histidine--tRNA ligase [Clostridia bacterium]